MSRSGDRDAEFVAFVQRSGRALSRTAVLLTGDATSGEDLLQTALTKVYVRWSATPDIAELERYVRRVLATTHLSAQRRRSSTEILTAWRPEQITADIASDIAPDLVQRDEVLWALRQLSAKQRTALVFRFFDDLSEAETGRLMGCSVGAVKQHTSRGLAHLRGLLPDDVRVTP